MGFSPQRLATAIGSFPHKDAGAACDLILRTIPEIPVWPQLPAVDFREGMEIQYSEGLPCVVIDSASQRMYFDTSGDPSTDLAAFYEHYLAEDTEYFGISREFARGIYEMEKRLSDGGAAHPRYFKNHVTGPVTLGLSRTDENKRAIYYNDVFRDVIVKGMEMKARWLLRKFASLGCPQICFIDEPILSAFGSSTYVSLDRSDVVRCLADVVQAIHKENALAGTHCCGNTEWTMLVDAGVDIISFDAYQYGETIGYYPEEIESFLKRGGVLAWGIVPSTGAIDDETSESLVEKLDQRVGMLSDKGIDRDTLWERCLITPSCGTGSIAQASAEKVLGTLSEVSRTLRNRS
jgi:methionine synthase II (cobalamin-independent)